MLILSQKHTISLHNVVYYESTSETEQFSMLYFCTCYVYRNELRDLLGEDRSNGLWGSTLNKVWFNYLYTVRQQLIL